MTPLDWGFSAACLVALLMISRSARTILRLEAVLTRYKAQHEADQEQMARYRERIDRAWRDPRAARAEASDDDA